MSSSRLFHGMREEETPQPLSASSSQVSGMIPSRPILASTSAMTLSEAVARGANLSRMMNPEDVGDSDVFGGRSDREFGTLNTFELSSTGVDREDVTVELEEDVPEEEEVGPPGDDEDEKESTATRESKSEAKESELASAPRRSGRLSKTQPPVPLKKRPGTASTIRSDIQTPAGRVSA